MSSRSGLHGAHVLEVQAGCFASFGWGTTMTKLPWAGSMATADGALSAPLEHTQGWLQPDGEVQNMYMLGGTTDVAATEFAAATGADVEDRSWVSVYGELTYSSVAATPLAQGRLYGKLMPVRSLQEDHAFECVEWPSDVPWQAGSGLGWNCDDAVSPP